MTVCVVTRPRKLGAWTAIAAGLVGLGGIVSLFHLDHLGVTFCMFKRTTGYPCMTCGTTRTLGRLIAGDFHGALLVNPLATVVMLGIVAFGLLDLALLARGRALMFDTTRFERRFLFFAAVILALVNWAYLIVTGV